MNAAEAMKFIRDRLFPDDDPSLDANEVSALLAMASADDTNGVSPGDTDWIATYNTVGCYRAIAEGWLIKRGKAVGRFDFTTDGQMFRRSQTLDQIDHQRKFYARKVQQSPSTIGANA